MYEYSYIHNERTWGIKRSFKLVIKSSYHLITNISKSPYVKVFKIKCKTLLNKHLCYRHKAKFLTIKIICNNNSVRLDD